jgi:predicted DNA-binding transcriptional regulator AlpA
MTPRLLTARELAADLGVSTGALLRWTRDGKVPSVKLPSGAVRYVPEQIVSWLEALQTAGGATEEVSPAPNAARQPQVSSVLSPVPPRLVAAPIEEVPDGRT